MDANAATTIKPYNTAETGEAKPHYYGAFGSWLEACTRLNSYREAVFDIIFYDTDNLSQDEVNEAAWLYSTARKPSSENQEVEDLEIKEGDVFVVKPTAWGGRGVERVSIDNLGDHCQGHGMAVAVPGVASSSIGAVSFARTVANGLQEPAVAIVAGRGRTSCQRGWAVRSWPGSRNLRDNRLFMKVAMDWMLLPQKILSEYLTRSTPERGK